MSIGSPRSSPNAQSDELKPGLKEIVLGLHWDPLEPRFGKPPADLDALCVLYDSSDEVLEVIHPAHPRSADGSVVHTGDSTTGASTRDDERIFVFLDALPDTVSRLAFIVASANGQPFHEVPGALCHVSDRASETEWVRIDLTALTGCVAYMVASLRRGPSEWTIATDVHPVDGRLPAVVQSLLGLSKRAGV
jgi:stress response protein SCP2